MPFRPQLLYELAKMDGAIIVNSMVTKLSHANVQLMPDPTIPSAETGTRHRTAERVAKQTDALVISISQQRETVTVFVGQSRYQLEPIADVLAKTNQALSTLETYRARLEQVVTRLTALEFQNAVMLDDVLVIAAARRADDANGRGDRARLRRARRGRPADPDAARGARRRRARREGGAWSTTITPRAAPTGRRRGSTRSLRFRTTSCSSSSSWRCSGSPRRRNPLDYSVSPRGYRVLSHIPRLPDGVVKRVVASLEGLEGVVSATQRELEAVEGVGAVRAREIREGLRRLQEHNLVDRYLQL